MSFSLGQFSWYILTIRKISTKLKIPESGHSFHLLNEAVTPLRLNDLNSKMEFTHEPGNENCTPFYCKNVLPGRSIQVHAWEQIVKLN